MATTLASHKPIALQSVGDAVWVAAALLQQANEGRDSFSVAEIVEKVKAESLTDKEDITIYLHANQHCVANRPPNPAKLRMLIDLGNSERRLYIPGDTFNSQRNGRTTPKREDLPLRYRPLLDWYDTWAKAHQKSAVANDPLLAMRGKSHGLWANEDPVDYINTLRKES